MKTTLNELEAWRVLVTQCADRAWAIELWKAVLTGTDITFAADAVLLRKSHTTTPVFTLIASEADTEVMLTAAKASDEGAYHIGRELPPMSDESMQDLITDIELEAEFRLSCVQEDFAEAECVGNDVWCQVLNRLNAALRRLLEQTETAAHFLEGKGDATSVND